MELERIKKLVNTYYKTDIDVKSRKREICIPRQVYFYLARDVKYKFSPMYTYEEILANVESVTNHATVYHAVRLIGDLINFDKQLKYDVHYLKTLVNFKFVLK